MMTRHPVSAVAACVLVLTACRPAAAEVVLAAGGSAQCTVVVGREDGQSRCHAYLIPDAPGYTQVVPTEVLKRSAADLAYYLNRLMGAPGRREDLVRVVEDKTQARTPCRILLGTAAIEEHGLQAEAGARCCAGPPGAFLATEANFRRIDGYRDLWTLQAVLDAGILEGKEVRVA